ncbi:TPA: hypothetical protein EYP38_03555 [Candidatus Micrarchaeota archaeon]|nr:hypothetical protein [Candidatus Micrarchaeota archaeon]
MDLFFGFLKPELFDIFSALLIITFIQWELPRSVKLMDEEYISDLYPEQGRVIDIVLFLVGLVAIYLLYEPGSMRRLIDFMDSTVLMLIFIPVMIAIPLIILMGFFKRFFARMDQHKSMTVFMVQTTLDFAHTLFFISLTLLCVPALILLGFVGP